VLSVCYQHQRSELSIEYTHTCTSPSYEVNASTLFCIYEERLCRKKSWKIRWCLCILSIVYYTRTTDIPMPRCTYPPLLTMNIVTRSGVDTLMVFCGGGGARWVRENRPRTQCIPWRWSGSGTRGKLFLGRMYESQNQKLPDE
jgi:hypothetical protein